MFYGLMVGMLLYNLFIYLSIRNNSYIHYVFFIIYMCLFTLTENGLGLQYLLPDSPFLNKYSHSIFNRNAGLSRRLVRYKLSANLRRRYFLSSFVYSESGGTGHGTRPPYPVRRWPPFWMEKIPAQWISVPVVYLFSIDIILDFWLFLCPCLMAVGLYAGIRQSIQKTRQAYYYLAAWVALLFPRQRLCAHVLWIDSRHISYVLVTLSWVRVIGHNPFPGDWRIASILCGMSSLL